MKRNKKLLLKTAQRIEDVPESYDQRTFVANSEKSPCGTVSCLAGEIIIASERSVKKGVEKLWNTRGPANLAGELAGFDSYESFALFGSSAAGWPAPFADKWYKAKTQRTKAKAAAALLRYLADGGEV